MKLRVTWLPEPGLELAPPVQESGCLTSNHLQTQVALLIGLVGQPAGYLHWHNLDFYSILRGAASGMFNRFYAHFRGWVFCENLA